MRMLWIYENNFDVFLAELKAESIYLFIIHQSIWDLILRNVDLLYWHQTDCLGIKSWS